MRLLQRMALLGASAVLATGCSHMGGPLADKATSGELSEVFSNPTACAVAGAVLAGSVGAIENRESAALGALAGGALGWWACKEQEKPGTDSDKDGVADAADQCPGTPAGAKVGANGCAVDVDSDGDGVPDGRDKCAGTAKGASVDANGCVAVADVDGDGVSDAADMCPGTAAGVKVLSNGCETDGDNDGVPDSQDRCAGTPRGSRVGPDGCTVDSDGDGVSDLIDNCPGTRAGAKVDANGCEPAAKPAAPMSKNEGAAAPSTNAAAVAVPATAGESVALEGVAFESASAKLTRDSLAILDGVAAQLVKSGAKVEVSGHTDASGSAKLNRALSQRRAEVVSAYLASKGVAADKLVAKGYGSEMPRAGNEAPEGRARNRRVELKVLGN